MNISGYVIHILRNKRILESEMRTDFIIFHSIVSLYSCLIAHKVY